MSQAVVSVIIPTLNPGEQIITSLERCLEQTRRPDEIIVVDSASNDGTAERVQRFIDKHAKDPTTTIRFIPIQRQDFDHGATRDMALRESKGDFVLFLTQDALPADAHYIENILKPFADEHIAMVSGRQIPRPDARPSERLVRQFNYPAQSHVRSAKDIPAYGIKAFFATDVCSAYRRSAYLEVGGFEHPITTNEDMFIAAAFLYAGYSIAYDADAQVIHSHNFTWKQQYKRNYAMGREITKHQSLLRNAKVAGEGASLVKNVMSGLIKQHAFGELFWFVGDCAARLLGNRAGTAAAKRESAR
ncbi:Glycosyl transferase family 2 [Bifidobacterium avesanii]|uniref:Glycosyltransferase n=2 Tax=Bifidobacterium avesanii TaxID=1798157 RepID=A0A7K3TL12_9BIFI|nr:Glycosyl transferase family 2 [Bifidobacterium avesanii]NEG78963.1 glycosyltransferase [Bifidobacterium avesanii]